VVKLLLATGKVDPDAKDKYDITPLMRAEGAGAEEVAKLLLATGKVDPLSSFGEIRKNHSVQDYQMQFMLLEQQNKRRRLMAGFDQTTPPRG